VNALDVARAALDAAGGEAEAVAQVESSGLARFAGSEVHQPTLIENAVVTLRRTRSTPAASPSSRGAQPRPRRAHRPTTRFPA